jgi:chromosome segregation ATPase
MALVCRRMEVSRVDEEGVEKPFASLSGGEKSDFQMALFFALWRVRE